MRGRLAWRQKNDNKKFYLKQISQKNHYWLKKFANFKKSTEFSANITTLPSLTTPVLSSKSPPASASLKAKFVLCSNLKLHEQKNGEEKKSYQHWISTLNLNLYWKQNTQSISIKVGRWVARTSCFCSSYCEFTHNQQRESEKTSQISQHRWRAPKNRLNHHSLESNKLLVCIVLFRQLSRLK